MGRNRPKSQILDAAGREVSRRALQKFLSDDVGSAYALADLQDRAQVVWSPGEPRHVFVRRALEAMRVRRHPGNHVYVFALGGPAERRRIAELPPLKDAHQRRLGGVLDYPKRADALPAFSPRLTIAA